MLRVQRMDNSYNKVPTRMQNVIVLCHNFKTDKHPKRTEWKIGSEVSEWNLLLEQNSHQSAKCYVLHHNCKINRETMK